ncbi:hypothetical protein GCK72_010901 [Caenorhabditis remanei]|uniref:Uncharacterized protein n=1 Tax=Caenorhabditis remanei TaxID=31234 RepID=A0A6A5H6E5_CAERE|nr:hypothetical protein GCK72_010901 [Caenorhabditis remanei]KAF1762639.1 hypothetical protein GCK72_010901 [Caenorhabditis remanei]
MSGRNKNNKKGNNKNVNKATSGPAPVRSSLRSSAELEAAAKLFCETPLGDARENGLKESVPEEEKSPVIEDLKNLNLNEEVLEDPKNSKKVQDLEKKVKQQADEIIDLKKKLKDCADNEERLKYKLVNTGAGESKLAKSNRDLREKILRKSLQLDNLTQDNKQLVSVLSMILSSLPNPLPPMHQGNPAEQLLGYQDIKRNLESGVVLREGVGMMEKLISISNKPEIQAQAAQEIQVYEQGYIDYLQALEFNITKIVTTGRLEETIRLPDFPSFSANLITEYFNETELQPSSSRPAGVEVKDLKSPGEST